MTKIQYTLLILKYISKDIHYNTLITQQMNQSKEKQHQQSKTIPQSKWHSLVPAEYVFKTYNIQLAPQRCATILKSQTSTELKNILTQKQKTTIENAFHQIPTKALYIKVNGRTPKDLPLINREIHKVEDVLEVIHSSQYILESIHKDKPTEIILREFIPQITHNNKIFDVFVRGGFTLAIGQKICDHIQEEPTEQEVDTIINLVQTIMPAITLVSQSKELNSFLVSVYCKNNTAKITSIKQYPPYPNGNQRIFSEDELQKYYKQIQENQEHKSEEQRYFQNQGVIPLIRTVKKQEDIKHYDMGQYMIGNQIDNEEKLEEWKQFMKEANQKLAQ